MDGRWRVMAKVKYVGKVHEPIQSCKKHTHEYWEVVRYTRGRGYVEMGEGRVPFEEGDILVIPPHTVHSDHSENGFQNYHYEFEDNAFPFHTWLRLYDNENHDFLDITEKLYREYQLHRNHYKEVVEHLYNILFYYLVSFADERKNPPYVEFAVNEIVSNFSNPFYDFSATQERIPMNADYFRKLFSASVGMSPTRYLNSMRIDYAKRLLHLRSRSHLTVQEIAWMSGFRDHLYFSRVFRKSTGMSPKEWT